MTKDALPKRPCRFVGVPHPAHRWAPLVADPRNDRVLHLALAELQCPGVSASPRPTESPTS